MPAFPELSMPEVLVGTEESAEATALYAEWSDLLTRIYSGETDGMEELYQLFSTAVRFYLARQLEPDQLDNGVHDIFVVVVQAIRRGELREPERLMGFVRTIVRRQVAAYIDRVVHTRSAQSEFSDKRRNDNPTEVVAFHRRTELINHVLAGLSEKDREILTRFYVLEQSQDEICREMALSETQFRLLRSKAKARFGELGKKKLFHRAGRSDEPEQTIQSIRNPITVKALETSSYSFNVGIVLPVVAHAVAVFGDEKKASHWLATPLPLLGDRSPSQLLEMQEGVDLVEQVLTRIEHNIPS
jgi:RNA polymerase sigma-70 factor (ECF subfamily)